MKRKIHQSEQEAFLEMLRQCKGILIKTCISFVRLGADDLRDLYQDIVVALWQAWPNYRGESKTSTWATSVAIRTACQWRRNREYSPKLVLVDDSFFDDMAAEAEEPIYDRLYSLMESLDATDRRLLYRFLEGERTATIAEKEGFSEEAVRQRLYRVKKKLHQIKEQQDETD